MTGLARAACRIRPTSVAAAARERHNIFGHLLAPDHVGRPTRTAFGTPHCCTQLSFVPPCSLNREDRHIVRLAPAGAEMSDTAKVSLATGNC